MSLVKYIELFVVSFLMLIVTLLSLGIDRVIQFAKAKSEAVPQIITDYLIINTSFYRHIILHAKRKSNSLLNN